MIEPKLKAKRQYLSPVTASLNIVGSNRLFDYNTWKQNVANGTLDSYVDLLVKSENLDIDKFYEDYKIPFGDPSTIESALVNEFYSDRSKLIVRDKGVDKDNKFIGNLPNVIKDTIDENTQSTYEATDYDYIKKQIADGNKQYAKAMLQEHLNKTRVNQQGFHTWLADAGMLVGNVAGGFYTGFTKIVGGIGSLFAAIDEDNAGRSDDGYFDRVLYNFNKFVDSTRIDSVADAFAEWEYNYTHLYDENGNQTRQGAILKSIGTSLGEMLPSMTAGYIVGNIAGAAAGAIGVGAKAVSTITSATTKIVSQGLFYGTNIFMTDAGEQYKYFTEQGMSVPTGMVYSKALVKTGLQYGVEWGLGKVFGSTGLDRLTKAMDETGLFSKALRKVNNPTGRAILNFVGDAVQEGAEEAFQETTDFLTDALFHYWNNNFESKDWSWETFWDAAIAGAISSLLVGSAKILGTERVSVGEIKTNKDGSLMRDKNGEYVFKKMNKLASYQYGLDMQSFVENYESVVKAGKKLAELDDGSNKYNKAMLQYKAAYTQALAAQQMMSDYFGAIGKERFDKAEKVLESITKAMDAGKFDTATIESNQEALAMDLSELGLSVSLKQIKEVVTKSGATEAENIVDVNDVDNLELDDNTKEAVKKIIEQNHNVGKVVITKDGNRVVSLEDFIIVPKHLLLGPSEVVTTAHAEGKMMDKLVEEIEKLEYKKNAIEVLKEIYRQWNHQQIGDYISTDEVITALIFDNRFFGVVLGTNEKLSCDFALTLNSVVRNAFTGNTLFDAMFKKRVNECMDRWTNVALEFYANNLDGDASLFVQGLDKKQADNFKAELSKKLLLFNMGKTIVSSPSAVSKEVWDFIDRRIDNTRLDNDEKTRMKNLLRKGTAKQRLDILNTISSLYNYAFTSLYNGEYYMPMKGVQNQVFNHWLQNLGINITNMFDPYHLTDVELSQLGETVDTVSDAQIVEFRQQQFANSTNESISFDLVDGRIVINNDMGNNGHLDFQQLLYEQIENPTLNKKIPVNLRQTVKTLRNMLHKDVQESIGTILTVDDIIHNFGYLNDETYDDILDEYGTVNMMTVFKHVQKTLVEDTKGKYCILTKADGSFIIGEMVNIETIFEKDVEFPSVDSKQLHMLAQYLKPKYRDSFVGTASVRFNGDGNYYTPFETRFINGKPATVFANRITIDKHYKTKSEIMVALAHEITHVVQASWKLNAGITHNILESFNDKTKNAIIAEVKSLHPELFEGVTGESDTVIVNRFLYLSSGESVAFGLSNKISFYPIIVENNYGNVTITLENGKEFKVPRKVDETNTKRTIVSNAKKTFDGVYKGANDIKPTEDTSRRNAMTRAAADLRRRMTDMDNPTQNDYLELMYQMSKTDKSKEDFLESDVLCLNIENELYYLTSTEELKFLLDFVYPKLKIDGYKTSLLVGTVKVKNIDKFEHIDNIHGSGKINVDKANIGTFTQLQVDLSTFDTSQEMYVDFINQPININDLNNNINREVLITQKLLQLGKPDTLYEIFETLKSYGYENDLVSNLYNDYLGNPIGVKISNEVKNNIYNGLINSSFAKLNMLRGVIQDLGINHMSLSEFMELDIPVMRYQRGDYDITSDKFVSVYLYKDENSMANILDRSSAEIGSIYDNRDEDGQVFLNGTIFTGTIKGKDILLGVNTYNYEFLVEPDNISNGNKIILNLPKHDEVLSLSAGWYAGVDIVNDGELTSETLKLSTSPTKQSRISIVNRDVDVNIVTYGDFGEYNTESISVSGIGMSTGVVTLSDIIEYFKITNSNTDELYLNLVNTLFEKINKITDIVKHSGYKYSIILEVKGEDDGHSIVDTLGALGVYLQDSHRIIYDDRYLVQKGNDLLLHELLHCFSHNLIHTDYNNKHLKNISDIYEKITLDMEPYMEDIYGMYGTKEERRFYLNYASSSLDEFISELISNEYYDIAILAGKSSLLESARKELLAWLNDISENDYTKYLFTEDGYSFKYLRQEEALIPKPDDLGMFNGPLYSDGKMVNEEAILYSVCDISDIRSDKGKSDLELLKRIIKALGIDTSGKKLNEILKLIMSDESQSNGLTQKFIDMLKQSSEGYTSLYVGKGTFLIADGIPGRFKTYLSEREEHKMVQENKTEVVETKTISRTDVKSSDSIGSDITSDDIREVIREGSADIKKDPFSKEKRPKGKKFKYNPTVHYYHDDTLRKDAIETITDPDKMKDYSEDSKKGHKYIHRDRIAVQIFKRKDGSTYAHSFYRKYYLKESSEKRHITKEEFENTDLKYFKKVGDQTQLPPEVIDFVVNATGKNIDESLRKKIRQGNLTVNDLERYVIDNDPKDIDAQTFVLIRDAVSGRKNIRSAYELDKLTHDGIFMAGAIYNLAKSLKPDDPMRKLILVEFGKARDKSSLYDVLLTLESILQQDEKLLRRYQKYKLGLMSVKGINSVTDADIDSGKLEFADLNFKDIKWKLLKDCDGTISSIYPALSIARGIADPKKPWKSKYDKINVSSLDAPTGKGKYGEDVGKQADLISIDEIEAIAEELGLFAEDDEISNVVVDSLTSRLSRFTKDEKLKVILDLEHAGGKMIYAVIAKKILNGDTKLAKTFLNGLDQDYFEQFADSFSAMNDNERLDYYISYINSLTKSELNNLFILAQTINSITPRTTLYEADFRLNWLDKVTGSEFDKKSILDFIRKANPKPSQIANSIRKVETRISTLLAETRHKNLFLKKHGDLFEKGKDGKIKLKDTILKSGDNYKSSDELQQIYELIREIRKSVTKGAFKSEASYKNYIKTLKNMSSTLNDVSNALKNLKKGTMQSISYEDGFITVDVAEPSDIPNIFKEMMANGIGESGKQRLADNRVQEISPYEDVVETEGDKTYVKRLYKDSHLQAVLRDFIELNANRLATMSQDEAMELINFLLKYKAVVSEDQRPIVGAQEILLAYFLKVSRYGADTEIKYTFSDEIVTQMENKLDGMARFFGSGLSHWKTALSNLRVSDMVRMEYYTKLGIKLDKEDMKNLDKVVAFMSVDPSKTSAQVNKALSEYNDAVSKRNAVKITYNKKPTKTNEARLHEAESNVVKAEHKLEKYKTESDKNLIDMNRKFRESLQVFEETLLKKYKGTPSSFFDAALKIQRAMMLSAPSTWIRNVFSNILVYMGNKFAVKAGNVLYNVTTKLFPEKALREDLVDTQYTMKGDVSDTTVKYIKEMFVDSGLINTLIKGVSKYSLDDMGKLKSSESLLDMFLRAIADEMYRMYGIRTGTKWFNDFFNDVIQLVYKGMNDDKFIKSSAIKYFGHILEEDYKRYIKDTKRKHKLAYENDVKNKKFSGTYVEYSASKPAEIKTLEEYLYKDGGNLYGINKNVVSAFAKATSLASYDYMRTPNIFTRLEKVLREEFSEGAYYVYKQFFPFLSSSWNWFVEGCRYTPPGFIKSIIDLCRLENTIDRAYRQNEKGRSALPGEFAKYTAIRNLGKGAIGIFVWSVAIILGTAGVAGYDDEEESYVIYAGNHKVKIDDITGSKSFFMGLAFYEAFTKEGKSPLNAFTDVADVFLEDSLFEDVLNRLMYNGDSWGEVILDMPFNTIDMYYPNFIKSISKVFHQRDKNYSSNAVIKSLQKLIVNWLPLPEEWLGAQIQVNPYTGKAESFWNPAIFEGIVNYISPIDITYPQVSDVQFKAAKLGVNKSQLSGRYTINDVDITLTASQKTYVNQMYGKLNDTDLKTLMNDSKKAKVKMSDGTFKELKYSQMNEQQKKAAIETIMSNNSSLSKIYILTSSGQYKYYASDSEYAELRKLGITKNIYRKTKKLNGFIKVN